MRGGVEIDAQPSPQHSRKHSLKEKLISSKLEPNYLISSENGESFLTTVFESTLSTSSLESETSSKISSSFNLSTKG